jgi:hypothetical protein
LACSSLPGPETKRQLGVARLKLRVANLPKPKVGHIFNKSGICGAEVGTFPYKVNTFPYMVIIANVCWRDNNRNPQIFGGTAFKKWDCPGSEIGTVGNYESWQIQEF